MDAQMFGLLQSVGAKFRNSFEYAPGSKNSGTLFTC